MRTAILLALLFSGFTPAQVSQTGSELARAGWTEAAIAAFRKQIELTPESFSAHANLGRLYYQLQRYSEAVPELEKAVAINAEDRDSQINLGGAYLGIGQAGRGLAVLDKVVQDHPSLDTLNFVASCLASHKVWLDRAQQYSEAAVGTIATEVRVNGLEHITPLIFRRVSTLSYFWDTLGWVHFQRGNLDDANRFLNAAWLLSQQGVTGDHLGQLYERRGQKQEAIRAFAGALAAGGVLPHTRSRLASIVGGEDQIEPLVRRARDELVAMRTLKVGKLLAEKAAAEFYVALVRAPSVPEVKFIGGDERLRQFTKSLQAVALPGVFPDSTTTVLVRRGTLTCPGEGGECVLEMLTTTAAAKAESNATPSDTGAQVAPGVFRVGGRVTAPVPIHRVEPQYSEKARAAKLHGVVVLYVEITPEGLPSNLRVMRGLGMGLDEEAIKAVKKWKFRPGLKDGKPITVAATVEVIFKLL
jgi:TonB family protein